MRRKALSAVKTVACVLAVTAAVALFSGAPAHAQNPVMHNSSSTTSAYWGGGWGNTPGSKYGQFTCTTCHTSGLSGGNAKQVKSTITIPGVASRPVVFGSYTSFGFDSGHTTSTDVCDVCHSLTSHHRYDNTANGPNHNGNVDCTICHLHSNGFKKGAGASSGGQACDGCHSDLYQNAAGYGMHSQATGVSYKHFMNNALTTNDASLSGGLLGTSWYATNIPDSTTSSPAARRCLMCHVDHDQFKSQRAFNLRANVTSVPTAGKNRDDNLCLSCHTSEKTKAYYGPNLETKVMPIPFPTITYANATTVLNNSTHGYPITTTFSDGSTFYAVCAKCHNDSIGKNGESPKSSVNAQKGSSKFGEHNSTVPGRFAILSNEFYQRPASGTTLTLNITNKTVQVVPDPAWTPDSHQGHYLVVTGGGGANSRALVTTNSTDTLTLQTWPAGMDATASFDVADDNLPVDNVCFSCHSKNGQGKVRGANLDWYGQEPMSTMLENIYDIFVGDSGTLPATVNRTTSVTVNLKLNSWTTTSIKGFILKAPGGKRVISGLTAGPTGSGPYSYTLTVAPKFSSAAGGVQIIKPASHPVDANARHESDERVGADVGWNKGDQGTTITANSATSATQITDTSRLWRGSEFNGMKINFPNVYDAAGKMVSSIITGGGAGTVIFNPAVSGLSTTGGDNYYVGMRHVSCADCHNPHASFRNPEGSVTSADSTHITDASSANVPGWYDNIWTGYLLKVRSTAGAEQIRFVTGFVKSSGGYTVSLPWITTPDATYTYEVLMGDKWTSVGQSGGRAGSGSSGIWGVAPTGWRPVPAYGNMTGVSGVRKIENVFDNVSTTGLRGSTITGQRDLCVRCHSSYSYGTATPMTPSGGPALNSNARSTDLLDEFNPNNPAHHAVYARGRNQPIMATGDVAGHKSSYNPYWPAYGALTGAPYTKSNLGAGNDTTKTVSVATTGVATFSGGSIPSTVQPGWFIYVNTAAGGTAPAGTALAQGATKGWFEVVTVDSTSQVTVKPKPTAAYSGSYFKLTAGLGNNFVPPFGPWSILRCTDCHGSTKTDPVGPHASVNKWLLKSLDTTLSFDWYDGSATIATKTPNTGAVAAIFCFNCHRRDVYGDLNSYTDATAIATNKIAFRSFSRQVHSGTTSHPDGLSLTGMFNDDSGRCVQTSTLVWGDISCRHCHAGDKVGGIHGTNAVATKSSAPNFGKGQGKRFLNGATWAGYNMPTTGTLSCYTKTASTSVSTCNRTSNDTATSVPLYNYTSARY
ncbi:MAG: hypothetical protein JJE30_17210 [Desulfuromonadales bacterium]|nr:hypothetical protein [Desulfuromonadales bacterium]